MKPVAKILAIALAVLLVAGLCVSAIVEVRAAAARMKCQNNLKRIGIALHNYHDCNEAFPRGTIDNPDLPPDRRLGWYVEIFPAYIVGGEKSEIDRSKAWDDPVNCPPRVSCKKLGPGVFVLGHVRLFQCLPVEHDPDLPDRTHYLGVAGVGLEAARLPVTDPLVGFFGYDRKVTNEDLKDGVATSITVMESMDGGPWTAGGRATVRGLDRHGEPYIGGQFSSQHRQRTPPWSKPMATNALFADGSVRLLTSALAPEIMEALVTIAGGDDVSGWNE